MKILRFLIVITMIFSFSCRDKEFNNPLDDWFQDPPVAPVTQTIKTVVPIAYAASLVVSDMKGFKTPNTKVLKKKASTIIYVNTSVDYPFQFKGDTYGEMVIAYIHADENTAFVSVFFTDMDIVEGKFELQNVIAFPVSIDQITGNIMAIFASIDINLGSNLFADIDLTQEEEEDCVNKLGNKPIHDNDDVEIGITQDAWIIEIDHNGTYDDITDDSYIFSGGQQAVSVEDYEVESSVGALQMAMVGVEFSSDCLENPTSGYVFMQDIEVESSTNNSEIVFGHVFYEFTPSCDGQILVDIATGNFLLSIGSRLDLGLN